MLSHRIFETAFGPVGIIVSPAGLRHVIPPATPTAIATRIRKLAPDSKPNERLLPNLVAKMKRYFDGEAVAFDVALDFGPMADFTREVLIACAAIPYGEITTYGDLAKRVGHPGAARGVGTAMSKNPLPIIVPCHRVCASGGKLGGYSGPEGVPFKERLLLMECGSLFNADSKRTLTRRRAAVVN